MEAELTADRALHAETRPASPLNLNHNHNHRPVREPRLGKGQGVVRKGLPHRRP